MRHAPEIIDKLLCDLINAMGEDEKPSISIKQAAKLIGVDEETLRVSISNGTCPFGFGGQHRDTGTRFGRVSKLALWSYLTKGVCDLKGQNRTIMEVGKKHMDI